MLTKVKQIGLALETLIRNCPLAHEDFLVVYLLSPVPWARIRAGGKRNNRLWYSSPQAGSCHFPPSHHGWLIHFPPLNLSSEGVLMGTIPSKIIKLKRNPLISKDSSGKSGVVSGKVLPPTAHTNTDNICALSGWSMWDVFV